MTIPLIDTPGGPYARVIADSVSPDGARLTTIEVKLHRYVLAELNTHRAFSRNSASSRAVPVKKMLDRMTSDPAWPIEWGVNQPGMQAHTQLEGDALAEVEEEWLAALRSAFVHVTRLTELGLHKQVANRLLEPFLWHVVIVTATEWENFWAQRCHPDAQPEMRVAAVEMRNAYIRSAPTLVVEGEWHLPYIQPEERAPTFGLVGIDLAYLSVARCARVSYLTHDGKRSVLADAELFKKLRDADPPHWSPFEHVATPCDGPTLGNFDGWEQLRHWRCPPCRNPEWTEAQAAEWGIPPHACWRSEVDCDCQCVVCHPADTCVS